MRTSRGLIRVVEGIFAALALALLSAPSLQAQVIAYDDTTTNTGQYTNGGAAAGNITFLVADDITTLAGAAGQSITQITFSVSNVDPTASFSARPRVRFYMNDGAGGGPGTLITGFSFNPILFNPNSIALFFFNPGAGFFVPANGVIWAGMTFDNVGGTATTAQLNELGQGTYNPPTVGSSTDNYFQTTAPGSFLVNNPAGTQQNFGGNPVANFGWQFQIVPEPSSIALLSIGSIAGLIALRRRRG